MLISLAMISIVAYMMVQRTRTIMSARHAAWIGAHLEAAYASTNALDLVESNVCARFFVETNLVRVFALDYSSGDTMDSIGEGLDSFIEDKSTEGASYLVEYGLDAASPDSYGVEEDEVPYPLNLYYSTFPFTGDQETWEGTRDRPYFGGTNAFGIVSSRCQWDNVDETWKCFGSLLDYLWDLAVDAVSASIF